MPFVTVVTLGAASAASDLISSVVKPNGKEADGENNSKLVGIRELSENEHEDFPVMINGKQENSSGGTCTEKGKNGSNKSNVASSQLNKKGKFATNTTISSSCGASKKCSEKIFSRASSKGTVSSSNLSLSFNFGNLAQSKRKSVSFVDLRSAGNMLNSSSSSANTKGSRCKNKLLALIDLSPTNSMVSGAESGYDGSGDDSGSCRSSTSSRSSSSSSCSPPVAHLLLEELDEEVVVEEDDDEVVVRNVGFSRGKFARGKALSHTDLTLVGRRDSSSELVDSTQQIASTSTSSSSNNTTTTIISSNSSSTTISGIIPTDDTGPSAISSISFIPCHEDDYIPQVIEVSKPLTLSTNSNCYTSTVNISASTLNLSSGFSSLLNTPSPSIASFSSAHLINSSAPSALAAPAVPCSTPTPTSLLSSHIPKLSGTVQGRTNIWKTWIRNKFNLNRNGKYSLEGSMASLGPFNVKAVKRKNQLISRLLISLKLIIVVEWLQEDYLSFYLTISRLSC